MSWHTRVIEHYALLPFLPEIEDFYNQYIVATLYFCIRLHHEFLGVRYILNIIISFFINILPIEIDLQFFTVVAYGKFG